MNRRTYSQATAEVGRRVGEIGGDAMVSHARTGAPTEVGISWDRVDRAHERVSTEKDGGAQRRHAV